LVIEIETSAELVGCRSCGVVATGLNRMPVEYRDLAAFGRPTWLRWTKRRRRCREPECSERTWTEISSAFSPRCSLTDRAGLERVGEVRQLGVDETTWLTASATRLANRCLDQVRRRVQNDTLGHRGRKRDPLYRIRKLMTTGAERLDERGLDRLLLGIRLGDPEGDVLSA
jgi:transposase